MKDWQGMLEHVKIITEERLESNDYDKNDTFVLKAWPSTMTLQEYEDILDGVT